MPIPNSPSTHFSDLLDSQIVKTCDHLSGHVVYKEEQPQQAAANLSILWQVVPNSIKQHLCKGNLKQKYYRSALNEDFLHVGRQS